jgi:RNA polymerase sigma factor (sigma-70 family)
VRHNNANQENKTIDCMTTAQYNQCVDDYSDGVYRFILKNIRDEEQARDIIQDSFEKMWIKVNDISYEKARSYLFTTAYHTMIDTIRRDRYQHPAEEADLNKHSYRDDYTGLKEILEDAVARLPEVQRSVIMLRDYEGYSYAEIGQITGLNESQVKVYIYRARVTLKNFIGSMDAVI